VVDTLILGLLDPEEARRPPMADRWRAITGAHLVPLVRAGARFENGQLVERNEVAA
jgi:hypothetical protein